MDTRDAKGSCLASNLLEGNSSEVDLFSNKITNKQQEEEVETLTITSNAPTNNNLATTTEHIQKITAGNHLKKAEHLALKFDCFRDKAGM